VLMSVLVLLVVWAVIVSVFAGDPNNSHPRFLRRR
jgi:hypothetical protein